MSEVQTTAASWFNEENGQRKGPVSEEDIVQYIKVSCMFDKVFLEDGMLLS